jgi:hypothetical protein
MNQILHQLYDNVTTSPIVIRIATNHAHMHQLEHYDTRIEDVIHRSQNTAAIKITMKLDDFLDMEKRLKTSVVEKQRREADPRLMELYIAYQTFLHLTQ